MEEKTCIRDHSLTQSESTGAQIEPADTICTPRHRIAWSYTVTIYGKSLEGLHHCD